MMRLAKVELHVRCRVATNVEISTKCGHFEAVVEIFVDL